jgi:hypothetical protein
MNFATTPTGKRHPKKMIAAALAPDGSAFIHSVPIRRGNLPRGRKDLSRGT